MSSALKILEQSPYDDAPRSCSPRPDFPESTPQRWVPSHYTVRASLEDGRLILWNTYKGALSVFPQEQHDRVVGLLQRRGVEKDSSNSKALDYLEERGFVVPEGTDEYRRFQQRFGQRQYRTNVLQLTLMASEDCNFRCRYCYEKFERGTMLPGTRQGIRKLVESRLDELESLAIAWFGGEPLYGMAAIEELAPFFHRVAQERDLHFLSHMTTNGYLLTPDVAKKLLSWGITEYQITLDGPAETHDKSRPARNGEGTFDTIFDNLRAMSRLDEEFEVVIRVNFDMENQPHLAGLLDLVEKAFESDPRFTLRFHAVNLRGGENDDELQVCGYTESQKLITDIEQEIVRRGLSVANGIKYVNRFGSQVCYAARPYHFVVGADGTLMKCSIELDTADANIVGRVTDDGELELDEDKMALWTEPAYAGDKKCQKCVVLPLCQGNHCPLNRRVYDMTPCTPLRRRMKQTMHNFLTSKENEDASNAATASVRETVAAV